MPRARRRLAPSSTIVALALALAGCKKDDAPASAETTPAAADAKTDADAPPASDAAQSGEDAPVAPADGTVVAPALPEIELAAELDPLLDLVPKDAKFWAVCRDPGALLSLVHPFALASTRVFADHVADPKEREEITAGLAKYAEVRSALAEPEYHLDRGVALVESGGEPIFIHAADDPKAFGSLLAKVTGEPDGSTCAAIAAAPGWSACAETAEALAGYTPGKSAAERRREMGSDLPGVDLERANVVSRVADPKLPLVVETPPGLLQVSFGGITMPPEVGEVFAPGPAPALGLLGSEPAFIWTSLSVDAMKTKIGAAPQFGPIVGALTGEAFIGILDSPPGLAVLGGVKDPAPIAGLLSIAALQLDQIPSTLPDGSKLKAALESVELDGAKTQALHVTLTPSAQGSAMYGSLGLKPEGWAFASGKYAGAIFGIDLAALQAFATDTPTGPSAETIAALPPALGRALLAGEVVHAAHLPLDGLATISEADLAMMGGTTTPGLEGAPFDPAQMMRSLPKVMAPLSSLSTFGVVSEGKHVQHVAITVFGDARSPDGKEALQVLEQLLDGKDPAPLYAALVAAHGDSARGPTYRARTGGMKSGTLVSVALLGVLAAIAIPAFTKYIERSKAAGAAPPPP